MILRMDWKKKNGVHCDPKKEDIGEEPKDEIVKLVLDIKKDLLKRAKSVPSFSGNEVLIFENDSILNDSNNGNESTIENLRSILNKRKDALKEHMKEKKSDSKKKLVDPEKEMEKLNDAMRESRFYDFKTLKNFFQKVGSVGSIPETKNESDESPRKKIIHKFSGSIEDSDSDKSPRKAREIVVKPDGEFNQTKEKFQNLSLSSSDKKNKNNNRTKKPKIKVSDEPESTPSTDNESNSPKISFKDKVKLIGTHFEGKNSKGRPMPPSVKKENQIITQEPKETKENNGNNDKTNKKVGKRSLDDSEPTDTQKQHRDMKRNKTTSVTKNFRERHVTKKNEEF